MKTILAAGLAGTLLSGAVLAQDAWTHLECRSEVTERLPDGGEEVFATVTHFRFNADEAELYDPLTGAWIHDCVEGDGYFGASLTISDSEIRCIRAGTNEAGGELYFDRSIYRETGRFTVADHSYGEGAWRHWTAEGLCVASADPSADTARN